MLAYRNTLESVHGTNQYWVMNVMFHAQGNNGLPLTGFEPMRLAILRLQVRRVNQSTTRPEFVNSFIVINSSEETQILTFIKIKAEICKR